MMYSAETTLGIFKVIKKNIRFITEKNYADSSFYSDPNKYYPTIEEQIEMARKVADSLQDPENLFSKGVNMFEKQRQRADKHVREGPEPEPDPIAEVSAGFICKFGQISFAWISVIFSLVVSDHKLKVIESFITYTNHCLQKLIGGLSNVSGSFYQQANNIHYNPNGISLGCLKSLTDVGCGSTHLLS